MNPIIQALDNAWNDFKAWLEKAETWLVALIKAEFTLDRQILIQALTADLVAYGKTIQADAPGTSAKTMGTQLWQAVEGQFAAQALSMLWQDVSLAVTMAVTQLNPPQTTGNAGTLPGGEQTGS